MLNVRELQPAIKGSVSWTDNSVSYYCHTVDRTKLEKYFNNMKHTKKGVSEVFGCERQLIRFSQSSEQQTSGRRIRSHGSDASSTDSSNDSTSSFSPRSNVSPPVVDGGGGASSSASRGKEGRASSHNGGGGGKKPASTSTTGREGSPIFFGPTTRRAWKEQTSEHNPTVSPTPTAYARG